MITEVELTIVLRAALLTRLTQYRAQKQAEAARSRPGQPSPESEASDDPPTAK